MISVEESVHSNLLRAEVERLTERAEHHHMEWYRHQGAELGAYWEGAYVQVVEDIRYLKLILTRIAEQEP